jgi:hypothetical protein
MMEHPDDSAPATLRAGELIGKFHGEKAATGPIGWWCTVCCKPRPGRDHAAIEAHACRRIPFHSMTFMRWSIDRSCHCIHILHRGIHILQAVFIYSIALRGIQAKFVEVAPGDTGNDF